MVSEAGSGPHNPSASDSRLSPALSVNEALLAFASMDHASLLGLGDLDIQGIRELGAFDSVEGTPEGMLIDGGDEDDGGNVGVDGDDDGKDIGGGASSDADNSGLKDGASDVDPPIS